MLNKYILKFDFPIYSIHWNVIIPYSACVWTKICKQKKKNKKYYLKSTFRRLKRFKKINFTLSDAISDTLRCVCIVSNWSRHQSNSSMVSVANLVYASSPWVNCMPAVEERPIDVCVGRLDLRWLIQCSTHKVTHTHTYEQIIKHTYTHKNIRTNTHTHRDTHTFTLTLRTKIYIKKKTNHKTKHKHGFKSTIKAYF